MKKGKLYTILRIIFGLGLLAFGVMGLFFLQAPSGDSEGIKFMVALINSGYLVQAVALVEIASGIMLLFNRYVALAAVLMAPISINMVLYHVFLDLPTILPALVVVALNIYFARKNWDAYAPLLK